MIITKKNLFLFMSFLVSRSYFFQITNGQASNNQYDNKDEKFPPRGALSYSIEKFIEKTDIDQIHESAEILNMHVPDLQHRVERDELSDPNEELSH